MKVEYKMRRFIGILICLLVAITLYGVMVLVKGYYPIPMLIKTVYYINAVESGKKLERAVVDLNFKFFEEGYSVSKKIEKSYPLPHLLILVPSKFTDSLPLDFVFKGEFEIKIFREEELVYRKTTNGAINYCKHGQDGKPSQFYYFQISQLPFPLGGKAYENLTVKVTVLKTDLDLSRYIDTAGLYLAADLRL